MMKAQTHGDDAAYGQAAYRVRFDWGRDGASGVAAEADLVVLVDVLSFTTTLSVAVEADIAVLPYPHGDESARRYAEQHGAVLAVGRSEARPGEISLSPSTVGSAQRPDRLVLPSPNGSAIAHELVSRSATCVAACLRNTDAVAAWISSQHDRARSVVAVIAAGERWPNGGLRPAAEDLWGAGAVIAGFATAGWTGLSPEAELARASYEGVRGREVSALLSCASGRELVDRGYRSDVEIAAQVNLGSGVPLLDGLWFTAAR